MSFRFRESGDKAVIQKMSKDMSRREAQLSEIEQTLPKENGLYLKIILGNVNVSILNKNEKYAFKLRATETQLLF